MDVGEVMKNVVEKINNVIIGNEINSELEMVFLNCFMFFFKIFCIYDKCLFEMYIVFWIGNIMLLMGIFGNVYIFVKIVLFKLYRLIVYVCIIMLVIINMVVLVVYFFRFFVFINVYFY